MKYSTQRISIGRQHRASGFRSHNQGVALITTLILLALLSAASLAMFLLVSSDTMINGYYRSYRGSFYAADSGVNVVVEAMNNAIQTAASPATNPPLTVGGVALPTQASQWVNAGASPGALTAAYTAFEGTYYTIGDTGSWRSQFKLLTANPDTQPIVGTPQFEVLPNDSNSCMPVGAATCTKNGVTVTNTNDYQWYFAYPYEITIQGVSSGNESEQITEKGILYYHSISGTGAGGTDPSFAKWGAFITQFDDCQGPLVPGTMTGPFFTDGQWNFGDYSSPGYTFTDSIGQMGNNVSWWTGSSRNPCQDSPNAPRGFNQPNFQAGIQLGQSRVEPPTNSYNQAQAVLDAKGIPPCTAAPCPTESAPTQSQMNQELKTISGTAYPSSGSVPSGVYIPYYVQGGQYYYGGNQGGTQTAAGGFYVQGNASVTLSATTGGDGTSNPTQTYTITQGSGHSATTTTIVIDDASGVTTVNGTHMNGVPQQLDPNSGAPITMSDPSGSTVSPTLIYVNGQITGMSGTIQNDTGITVAASDDISITGDLTYTQSPVSIPADTLNSSTNAGGLGIYTNNNINLYPNSSGSNRGNLTVDASLAAIGGVSGDAGFETPGNGIGTWTIVGGRSEDHAHSVNINQGNTYYDRRFASGSFGPPWFPTAIPQPGNSSIPSSGQPSVVRTLWREVR
jgi:hypothetical protein